jgi:UDP-GlcNAc:undecaprenyl-phosphate GlcNAc-1-phosphate transferase
MLLYPILALVLAVTVMPLCIRLARRYGLFDAPDAERKMHAGAVPFTGGYAIVISFALTFTVMWLLEGESFFTAQYASFAPMYMYIAEATLIIVILGIIDDLRELTYSQKFFFQFIASFLMILGAIKSGLFPSVFSIENSGVLVNSIGMVVSLLWLVGTTNAINMIDGMDGLAGATSLISASALAAVAFLWGNPVLGIVLLTLAGAITGFLVFNLPPARVFMGDGGSMFIGFILAFSGWMLVDSGPKDFIAVLVPIIILGLPVSDTLLAFFRRIVRGTNPFVPDLYHIHHMLARRTGLPLRRAVLLLSLIALVYGAAGVAAAVLPTVYGWMLIGAVLAGKFLLLHKLGYTDMLRSRDSETHHSHILAMRVVQKGAPVKTNGVHVNGKNGVHVNGNGNGKLNGNGYHPEKKSDVKHNPDANAA